MKSKTEETKDYFDNNTKFWSSLFSESKYGTATQRIRIVSNKIKDILNSRSFETPRIEFTHLDFGCGTGELAADSVSMGAQVIAIDIAPGMVDATRSALENKGAQKVQVIQGGIGTLKQFEANSIDAFSALGLIEYLTLSELNLFFESLTRILRPNGRAFIGSRNRLFNIFSENKFTDLEVKMGEYEKLTAEANCIRKWVGEGALVDLLNDASRMEPFSKWTYPDELPRTSHVSVSQRIQYSVCDLSSRAVSHGLKIEDINSVRFHPAKMRVLEPNVHSELIDKVNLTIDEYGDTKWALPCSSSYLLELAK